MASKIERRRFNRVKLALFGLLQVTERIEDGAAKYENIDDLSEKDKEHLNGVTKALIKLWDAFNG